MEKTKINVVTIIFVLRLVILLVTARQISKTINVEILPKSTSTIPSGEARLAIATPKVTAIV